MLFIIPPGFFIFLLIFVGAMFAAVFIAQNLAIAIPVAVILATLIILGRRRRAKTRRQDYRALKGGVDPWH